MVGSPSRLRDRERSELSSTVTPVNVEARYTFLHFLSAKPCSLHASLQLVRNEKLGHDSVLDVVISAFSFFITLI